MRSRCRSGCRRARASRWWGRCWTSAGWPTRRPGPGSSSTRRSSLFLLTRRLRPFAYVAVLGFHAATLALFPIGMFPVIMVTAALVFFDPAWPRWLGGRLRALVRREPRPVPPISLPEPGLARPGWKARWMLGAAVVYGIFQIAFPLRTHLYGGNVLWHEQGMRFSWRVMAREKNGSVTVRGAQPGHGPGVACATAPVPHRASGAGDVRAAGSDPAARPPHRP